MVAQNLSDATPAADTPTSTTPEAEVPNLKGHTATTIPWDDIAAVGLWQSGTAECGCTEHRHADDADELGNGAPATLHDSARCTRGRGDAELDPRLARHLNIPAADGAATVSVTPEELAGALRGVPAGDALAAVAAERAAEADYASAGIARIERRLAIAAELDARGLGGDMSARLRDQLPPPTPRRRYLPILLDSGSPVHPCGRPRYASSGTARAPKPAATAGVPPIGNLGGPALASGEVPPVGLVGGRVPPAAGFTAPPTGAVGGTAPAPTTARAPLSESEAEDLVNLEILRTAAADEVTATQAMAIAEAAVRRDDERARLMVELAPFLLTEPDAVRAELDALMKLTLADRDEVIEAVRSGRMTELGLRIRDLSATAPGSKPAWVRLREGAAGKWSVGDLVPFTDAEMQVLLNPVRPVPSIGKTFYSKGQHILAGTGGIGKTWIALNACLGAVPAVRIGEKTGPDAVYLDLDNNYELFSRASDLGIDHGHLQRRDVELMNVAAEATKRGAGNSAMLRAILAGLVEAPPQVVVVDSLTRVMADLGLDTNNDADATRALTMFDALAEKCCVIILDHTGHEAARPRGSSAKRDAVRVVITVTEADFDAEEYPHKIAGGDAILSKDRDGGIRAAHADPEDKSTSPDLGRFVVNRVKETGKAAVDFIPARLRSAAKERRASDAGVEFAEHASKVLRRVVDTAARAAIDAHRAKDLGVDPVPPLSKTGAVDKAWEQLKGDPRGKRSDVRAAAERLLEAGELVKYIRPWGSTGGDRLRCRGGVSGDQLDPVALD